MLYVRGNQILAALDARHQAIFSFMAFLEAGDVFRWHMISQPDAVCGKVEFKAVMAHAASIDNQYNRFSDILLSIHSTRLAVFDCDISHTPDCDNLRLHRRCDNFRQSRESFCADNTIDLYILF